MICTHAPAKSDPSPVASIAKSSGTSLSAPLQVQESASKAETLKERSQLGPSFEQASFPAESLQPATSGRPLPKLLLEKMESAFETDFSNVRVHEDGNAEKIGAMAYTQGKHLHFAPGRFRPHSQEGQKLIGHELAHVLQQQAVPYATSKCNSVRIHDVPALEKEANDLGAKASQGKAVQIQKRQSISWLQSHNREGSTSGTGEIVQCGKRKKNLQHVSGAGKAKRKMKGKSNERLKTPRHSYNYSPGQHGYKKNEQRDLGDKFSVIVSGDTHESEHIIGFEPLNKTSSGGKRGATTRARRIEKAAMAYQEVKEEHARHIGTGKRGKDNKTGFSSDEYRRAQRLLVETDLASSAMQLNQLAYAHNETYRSKSLAYRIAEASYAHMVKGMEGFQYAEGKDDRYIAMTLDDKMEVAHARISAREGILVPTAKSLAKAHYIATIGEYPDDEKTQKYMSESQDLRKYLETKRQK